MFTQVIDRDLGKHQTGKMVFALVAASIDPALKPPFDASAAVHEVASIGHAKDVATSSIHLTNRAICSLRDILQGKLAHFGLSRMQLCKRLCLIGTNELPLLLLGLFA